jgi:hypothetical protein
MGLFGKISKAFSPDVKVDIDAPQTFKSRDDFLQFNVQLRNRSDEVQHLHRLRVWLTRETEPGESSRRDDDAPMLTMPLDTFLEVGAEITVAVSVPLSLTAVIDGAEMPETPSWLKAVAGAADTWGRATDSSGDYLLSVTVYTESSSSSDRKRIRRLGPGSFHIGLGR